MIDNSSFVHAVATRIGIGVYDEQWFHHRLALFEAITLPSMASQTSREFTWLLVVDEQMPPPALARLRESIAVLPNTEILPVEFKSSLAGAVAGWGRTRAAQVGAGHVLTSRLDDDDALAVGCVQRLHEEAETFLGLGRPGRAAISFTLGTMWIPAERHGYTRYHDSHSLGLSVLEEVDDCRGIYAWPHQEIKQRIAPSGGYLRGIDGDRRWWLYAAHVLADSDTGDRKRLEKIRGHRYGYRVDDEMLAHFGLDPAVIDDLAKLPEPQVSKPVKRLAIRAMDTEREIARLRALMETSGEAHAQRLREQIAELESQRRSAGSGIVGTDAPVAAAPAAASSSPPQRPGFRFWLSRNRLRR